MRVTRSYQPTPIYIDTRHIFESSSDRDTYFLNHPNELKEDLYIKVAGELYRRSLNTWFLHSSLLQGPKGDKGDRGEQGFKGEKGDVGIGLQYLWQGTKLGIKRENEGTYTYTDLKGAKGDKGDIGVGLQYLWSGTKLGIKREDEDTFSYVDLIGPQGPKGDKGEPGIDGKTWLSGTADPSSALGVVGDFYLNRSTWDVYEKTTSTAWTKRGSIKGDRGEQGPKGDKGDKGDRGDVGPKGDKGDKGEPGAQGPKGDKGEPGAGVPVGGLSGQVLVKNSSTNYDTKWIDFIATPSWGDILNKPSTFPPTLGTTSSTAFRGDYGLIAYNHSQSAHAPSNAWVYNEATIKAVKVNSAGTADTASSVTWANVTGKPTTATRWPSWSEVTGKPSTFPPSSHSHDSINIVDIRGVGNKDSYFDTTPNDVKDTAITANFAYVSGAGSGWRSIVTLKGWTGTYAAWQLIGPASTSADDDLYFRSGLGTSWRTARRIWHDGNAPTTATRWPSWGEVTGKPSTFPPSSHTHSYLPLSGGTLTGNLYTTSSARIGVGTSTAPAYGSIHIAPDGAANGLCIGSTSNTFRLYQVSNIAYITRGGDNARGIAINTAGNVGFGTSAPAERVHSVDRVRADKGFTTGDFVIEYNDSSKCLNFNFVG